MARTTATEPTPLHAQSARAAWARKRKAAAAAIGNSCFSTKQHPGVLMDVCFDDKGDIDRESFMTEVRGGKVVVAETLPALN
jgi:branched-chain amino acid transport system substrate-binding protein